ncbi:hypothetical protein QCA50_010309 [Cerrena zonata]|uniref:protein-serine/threonine phosphatase n=1 Tax=Cerrena zonata TaxID=2478898 RepID=A0AAW0G909_9APHY
MELNRVQSLLEEVHKRFYEAYDAREEGRKTSQKNTRRKEHGHVPYDVRTIIPDIRMNTLRDVHILFSSVIPLDTRPESTEIWRTAEAFGATCYTILNKRITHVVAAKRGTVKVDSARRQGGVKIVWLSWFTDSIALWHKQDETNYLMDPPPPPPPIPDDNDSAAVGTPTSPHQISSDPEPDADDWDDDGRAGPDKESEALSGGVSVSTGAGAGGKVDGGEGGSGGGGGGGRGTDEEGLDLDEMIWGDMNDEVDEAMNESDDDESVRTGGRSENASEDDWTDESNSVISSTTSTPRKSRKRLRSVTPSDGSAGNLSDSDVLRSPLAKRKKIAADRSGSSKLKEAFSAADVLPHGGTSGLGVTGVAVGVSVISEEDTKSEGNVTEGRSSKATTPRDGVGDEMDEDDGDDGDTDGETEGGELDEDDDFLARELGEDWG